MAITAAASAALLVSNASEDLWVLDTLAGLKASEYPNITGSAIPHTMLAGPRVPPPPSDAAVAILSDQRFHQIGDTQMAGAYLSDQWHVQGISNAAIVRAMESGGNITPAAQVALFSATRTRGFVAYADSPVTAPFGLATGRAAVPDWMRQVFSEADTLSSSRPQLSLGILAAGPLAWFGKPKQNWRLPHLRLAVHIDILEGDAATTMIVVNSIHIPTEGFSLTGGKLKALNANMKDAFPKMAATLLPNNAVDHDIATFTLMLAQGLIRTTGSVELRSAPNPRAPTNLALLDDVGQVRVLLKHALSVAINGALDWKSYKHSATPSMTERSTVGAAYSAAICGAKKEEERKKHKQLEDGSGVPVRKLVHPVEHSGLVLELVGARPSHLCRTSLTFHAATKSEINKFFTVRGSFHGPENALLYNKLQAGAPVAPKSANVSARGKTTKDHLFLSPELAVYLASSFVDDTYFKDHAILGARFTCLGEPPKLPLWQMPKLINWSSVPELPDTNCPCDLPTDPSQKYEALLSQLETEVNAALTAKGNAKLHPRQTGRGSTYEVHLVTEYSSPPKKGRPGDWEPSYHGIDAGHAKWMRQMRRLVNLTGLCQVPHPNAKQLDHRNKLWNSILDAKDFTPNFASWWNEHCGSHAALGSECPGPAVAAVLQKVFDERLRQFEKILQHQRSKDARDRRSNDPQNIFRDLQGETQLPCQTLLHRHPAEVTEVDDSDCSIVVSPPQPWDESQPLLTDQGACRILHAENDKLWLNRMPENLEGSKIFQETVVSDIMEMFEEFRKEWTARWDKHLHTPDSFWQPVVDFVHMAIPPPAKMEYAPITLELWKSTLRKKSKKAAVGPDGLSRADLLHMPDHLTN
eukprot:s16_g13.t1